MNENWDEVMKLAEAYGFIRFAHAGVALLSIEGIDQDE